MSKGYLRMSLAEREDLSIQYAQGRSLRSIARTLHRSPSTLSRELARNRTGIYYRAVTASARRNGAVIASLGDWPLTADCVTLY